MMKFRLRNAANFEVPFQTGGRRGRGCRARPGPEDI